MRRGRYSVQNTPNDQDSGATPVDQDLVTKRGEQNQSKARTTLQPFRS